MTLEFNAALFKSFRDHTNSLDSQQLPLDIKSDYHPSDYQLALLANHAYSSSKKTVPEGWSVLATATACNGYDGVLYLHADKRQVVIAHRGTEPPLPKDNSEQVRSERYWFNAFGRMYDYFGDKVESSKSQLKRVLPTLRDLSTDFFGVAQGTEVSQIESSLDFTQQALKKLSGVDVLSFSVTGHSLGGWLAQLTTYEARRGGLIAENVARSLDLHCVVFDSPGAKNILEANEQTIADDFKTDLNTQLDITTYLSAPNLVNTCNAHVGTLYRIFPDFSDINRSTMEGWLSYLLHAHSMDNFCRFFSETEAGFPNQLKHVKKWPQVDWTKMEITKRSATHAFFRILANFSTGVESVAATLANVDYQQFEVVQQFCRIDDNQETFSFPEQHSMVREGHYSLGELEQNNTVKIPLRAFGVDIHNVLKGFNAYSALVKSGLFEREDDALVGLTSLKASLETRLGADSLRVLSELAPHCSLDGQALVLNTGSADVFGITQDNMHEPAWLRKSQYQLVQVVKRIFLAYSDLSITLHNVYLQIPSDILNAHESLKEALEQLNKKVDSMVQRSITKKPSHLSIVNSSDNTIIDETNTDYGHLLNSQTGYEDGLKKVLDAASQAPLPAVSDSAPTQSIIEYSKKTHIKKANMRLGNTINQTESQSDILKAKAAIAQQAMFSKKKVWEFNGVECAMKYDPDISSICYEITVIPLKFVSDDIEEQVYNKLKKVKHVAYHTDGEPIFLMRFNSNHVAQINALEETLGGICTHLPAKKCINLQ